MSTVLFQTIQFSMSTKLNGSKYCLCITNNSIKHQSFVYTELNIKTVLFQTKQFSLNTVFCLYIVKCKNSSISTISNNSV